jgi:hypothetical protein
MKIESSEVRFPLAFGPARPPKQVSSLKDFRRMKKT